LRTSLSNCSASSRVSASSQSIASLAARSIDWRSVRTPNALSPEATGRFNTSGRRSKDRRPHCLAVTALGFVCSPARCEVVRERKPPAVLDIRGPRWLRHAFDARIRIRHFYPECSTVPSEAQRDGLGAVAYRVGHELADHDERISLGDWKGSDERLRVTPRDRHTRRDATVTKGRFHQTVGVLPGYFGPTT